MNRLLTVPDLVAHLRTMPSRDTFVRGATVDAELSIRSTEDVTEVARLLGLPTGGDRRDTRRADRGPPVLTSPTPPPPWSHRCLAPSPPTPSLTCSGFAPSWTPTRSAAPLAEVIRVVTRGTS